MLILSAMLTLGHGPSLHLVLENHGLGMAGSPKGALLSMMFIVALYLPWCRYLAAQEGCRYLAAQEGVQPQLYADNLKCISRDPSVLLRAAQFTTGYVRLVGQEPAPSKCVLLSTSREVRRDIKDWVLSQEVDQWSVKFDVRDLGVTWILPFVDGLRL